MAKDAITSGKDRLLGVLFTDDLAPNLHTNRLRQPYSFAEIFDQTRNQSTQCARAFSRTMLDQLPVA